MFRNTCFGSWLDLRLYDHEPHLIEYMLRKQHRVDDSHYDMPLIYYMDGHTLHFGRREFALITGLRFGNVSFGLYNSGQLDFRNRIFPEKLGVGVTILDVIGVMEDEERFSKLCDLDVVRLCLLLVLEVIFMGRLLYSEVDDSLFRLVENIDSWNAFPWGEHIWANLYEDLKDVIENNCDAQLVPMDKEPSYVPTYNLKSFVFAFQVNFFALNCNYSYKPTQVSVL